MSEQVDKFIEVMALNLEVRSRLPATDVWPNPLADITLANDISGNHILGLLEEIFESIDKIEQIAKIFKRPARLVYLMYLFTLKPSNTEMASRRVRLAEKMISAISFMRNGDPFIEKGQNRIYNDNAIFDLVHFERNLTIDHLTTLRKILVALATLNEYSYFAWVGLGREFHGLYEYNGMKLFVRDYYDLNPDFWDYKKYIPWKSIVVITEENKCVKPVFDFNGRMYFNNQHEIISAGLLIDGQPVEVNEEQLQIIFEKLLIVLRQAKEETKDMNGNQLLLQYVKAQFYAIKDGISQLGRETNKLFPDNLVDEILNAKGESSFAYTLGQLSRTKDHKTRLDLLKSCLDPGNLEKLG
ncbi:MAG: hypothetical protein HFG35_11915 [Eubacterium sp.]|nr:hypothetical protein [Eubacterium sp.]